MIKEYNCDLLAVKLSTNDMDNLYKKNFTMYDRNSPIFIPSDNINDDNLSSSRIFEIGDILLLNVNDSFIKLYNNCSHFGMIRTIDNSIFNTTTDKRIIIVKRVITVIIFIIMILLPVLNFMNILISALFAYLFFVCFVLYYFSILLFFLIFFFYIFNFDNNKMYNSR